MKTRTALAVILAIVCALGLTVGFIQFARLRHLGRGLPNGLLSHIEGIPKIGTGYIDGSSSCHEKEAVYTYHWGPPSTTRPALEAADWVKQVENWVRSRATIRRKVLLGGHVTTLVLVYEVDGSIGSISCVAEQTDSEDGPRCLVVLSETRIE